MKYIQPKITGTFPALSTIKSDKGPDAQEIGTEVFTNGAGYQADE
jgi:hypothetical protein